MSKPLEWILGIFLAVCVAAVCLGIYGAFGVAQHVIVLVDDTDFALKHPVDTQTAMQTKAIVAALQSFVQDAADEMHAIAHPSKGQKVLNDVAKFVPHIF